MFKKNLFSNTNFSIFIFAIIFISFYISGFTNDYLSDADATRHAIDGIFLKDFILSGDYLHPTQFFKEYFAQYPSIGIMYFPLLFPFLEAIPLIIFGNHLIVLKLFMLSFAFLLFFMNYKLIKKLFNEQIAFFSTCFLMLSVSIIKYSQLIMLDVPSVALTICIVYLFYNYYEKPTNKNLIFLLIIAFLGLLLKETAMIIVPGLVAFLLIYSRKHLADIFKNRKQLLILAIFTVFSAIWLYLRYFVIYVNLVDILTNLENPTYSSLSYYFFYFKTLFFQTNFILAALFCIYLILWVFNIKKATKSENFLLLTFFGSYIILLIMSIQNLRYSLFLLIPVCTLATITVFRLFYFFMKFFKQKKETILFYSKIGLITLTVYLFIAAYFVSVPKIDGYDKAARFIVDNYDKNSVLFSGAGNGKFIFYARLYDKEMKNVILRDTIIFTYFPNYWIPFGETKIVNSKQEVLQKIKDYSVKYVVIEDKNLYKISAYEYIKDLLDDGDFSLLRKIPVESNSVDFKDINILIYQYDKFNETKKESINVYLPFVNETINLEFK